MKINMGENCGVGNLGLRLAWAFPLSGGHGKNEPGKKLLSASEGVN